jgi:hypothetical protein
MKTKSITIALTLATAAAAHAQVTTNVKTVSRYDAATNANVVDVRLPSPAFYTSFVTAVANAWNANRGGVVNFDLPQTSPWPSPALGTNLILGSYGIAGSQMIKIGVPMIGDINSHATVVPISEKGDMLSKKIGAMSLTLSASTGLIRQAGLTVLQQANIPQKVTVTFLQSAPGLPVTYTFAIPAGVGVRDTFAGATALAGCGITAVRITSVNATTGAPAAVHIDDFAFEGVAGNVVVDPLK